MRDRRPMPRQVSRWAITAITAVALLMTMAPAAVQAGRGITFNIELGHWCVSGRANDKALVKIQWKDDTGQLKAKGSNRANSKGYWTYCGDGDERVERGDAVKARVGSRTRKVIVPNLKMVADRIDDSVRGKALPNSTVKLYACKRFNFSRANCYEVLTSANTEGRFTYDFTGIANLIGRDWVYFTVKRDRDKFTRSADVPFIWVKRGKARFWGYYKPFKKLNVQLYRGGPMIDDWTGRADAWDWGYFKGRFADEGSDGDTYRVRTGDRIVIPKFGSDADWVVPAVAVTVNKSNDVVKGTCGAPGRRRFEVFARNASGSRSGYRIGKTASDGTFVFDMTRKVNIKTGDIVLLNCELLSGDVVARRTVVK